MPDSKSNSLSALQLLLAPQKAESRPVMVIAGDDGYLRHEVRRALLRQIGDEAPAAPQVFAGPTADIRDVLDGLCERSLFDDAARVVVIEEADPLIKQFRPQLEDYAAAPRSEATLVIEAASWPKNTKLAKAIAQTGLTIDASNPDKGREATAFASQLKKWLTTRARQDYECELAPDAADCLLELLPPQPGIVLQETTRLALLVGDARRIDAQTVRDNVGSWRARKTWDMIDAAAEGRAAEALGQLDRLIAAGEQPHALMPQMASTLRRFAMAVRVFEQTEAARGHATLRTALQQAGAPPFKLAAMERQLRQIGRQRARALSSWLLAADLDLKGHNSPQDRARRVLETLIVRLAKQTSSA